MAHLKMLKGKGVTPIMENQRQEYEFIIFDCSKQTQEKKILTSLEAIKLADEFEMERITEFQAKKEGLYAYSI